MERLRQQFKRTDAKEKGTTAEDGASSPPSTPEKKSVSLASASREDLLGVIRQQAAKTRQYEAKLAELVKIHNQTVKEKEDLARALEASGGREDGMLRERIRQLEEELARCSVLNGDTAATDQILGLQKKLEETVCAAKEKLAAVGAEKKDLEVEASTLREKLAGMQGLEKELHEARALAEDVTRELTSVREESETKREEMMAGVRRLEKELAETQRVRDEKTTQFEKMRSLAAERVKAEKVKVQKLEALLAAQTSSDGTTEESDTKKRMVELEAKIADLTPRAEAVESTRDMLEATKEWARELEAQVAQMKADLEEVTKERDERGAQLTKMKALAVERVKAERAKVTQLEGEKSRLEAALEEQGHGSVGTHEESGTRVVELEEKLSSLTKHAYEESETLRQDAEASRSRVAELEEKLSSFTTSAHEESETLRQDAEASRSRVSELEEKLSSFTTSAHEESETLRQDAEASRSRVSELEEKLSSFTTSAHEESETLRQDAEASRSRVSELEEKLSSFTTSAHEESETLRQDAEASRSRVSELEEKLSSFTTSAHEESETLRQDAEASRSRVAELEEKLSTLGAERSSGEEEMKRVDAALSAARHDLSKALEDLQDALKERDEKAAQVDKIKGIAVERVKAEKAKVQDLSATLKDLKTKYTSSTAETDRLTSLLESERSDFAARHKTHACEMDRLSSESTTLHSELESCRNRIATLEDGLSAMTSENTHLQDTIHTRESTLTQMRLDVERLSEEKASAERSRDAALSAHRTLEEATHDHLSEDERQRAVVASLETDLEASRCRVSELEEKLSSFTTSAHEESETLRQDAGASRSRVSELEEKLSSLTKHAHEESEILRQDAEASRSRVAELEEQMSSPEAKRSEAEAELRENLHNVMKEHEAERARVSELLMKKEEEKTSQLAKMKGVAVEKLKAEKIKVKELEARLAEAERLADTRIPQQIQALREEQELERRTMEEAHQRQTEELRAQAESLEERLRLAAAEESRSNSQIEELEGRLQESNTLCRTLEEEARKQVAADQSADADKQKAMEAITALTREHTVLKEKHEKLKNLLAQANKAIKDTKHRANEKQEELNRSTKELGDVRANLAKVDKELATAKGELHVNPARIQSGGVSVTKRVTVDGNVWCLLHLSEREGSGTARDIWAREDRCFAGYEVEPTLLPTLVEEEVEVRVRQEFERIMETMSSQNEDVVMTLEHNTRRMTADLETLQDEFSRYKLRAKEALKQKEDELSTMQELELSHAKLNEEYKKAKEDGQRLEQRVSDFEAIQSRCSELDEHLNRLKKEYEQRETDVATLQQQLRTAETEGNEVLKRVKAECAQAIAEADANHHARYEELREEYHATRERARRMMEDKDAELQRAMGRLKGHGGDPFQHHRSPAPRVADKFRTGSPARKESPPPVQPSGSPEERIMQLAHRQAEREDELARAQTQIQVLTDRVGEMEDLGRLWRLQEEVLKNEIRELERQKGRDGTDLEYLKNVIVKYMETEEPQTHQALLPVISTLLQFSPEERRRVTKKWEELASSSLWGKAAYLFGSPQKP